MELTLTNNPIDVKCDNETLLRTIDRGIDDMESGRELPLDEAFEKITELRNIRRNARA
ncbi:MAG: hypothetical protein HDR08_11855 [Lachnospiraceae bacterium]|nr:hypothetical protein [Lachnospiraceae bacterium]